MDSRPRAALWVGAALVALPLLQRPPRAEACADPAERAARDGRTTQVSCAGGAPVRGPARLVLGLGLDPNRADAASLEALPGIGPRLSEAIVAARRERRFADARDLERVPGIGPRTRARVEAWLAFESGPAAACGAR